MTITVLLLEIHSKTTDLMLEMIKPNQYTGTIVVMVSDFCIILGILAFYDAGIGAVSDQDARAILPKACSW